MDDFMLDVPKSTWTCNAVEDMQLQLAGIRDSKVTDSKAAYITATFEFGSSTVFHVPEKENDAVDDNSSSSNKINTNTQNPDQAHQQDGSSAAMPDTPAIPTANATIRDIRALDILINQPADDPSLQRDVAKHIVTCMGSVDGSTWAVRSVSRNASGWTFQYHCKNSMQAWMRQNSKNAAKVLVGESSGKDGQDPVLLGRPAFDCRGTVTIAFGKSKRAITVKLEHMPLHKTVADLAELFKPPPPPARAETVKRKDKESKKSKQKADGEQNGEAGSSKKKRKKPAANPDDPVAEGDAAAPKPKKPRPSKAKEKKSAPPEGEVEPPNSLLNLSPSEAARRREEATRKLTEAGVDPASLSAEQFDIFSNQSPDLQAESLNMLVKYGAERLRIVHPNKDAAAASAAASANPAEANGATPDGSAKKKKSKKKALNEDGTPKVKKTRGSCESCRSKKLKCNKAKPECDECLKAGISCYYPPQQSRKPPKSAEVVQDETDQPATDDSPAPVPIPEAQAVSQPVAAPEPQPEPEAEPLPEEEASDLGSPGFSGAAQPPAQDIVLQQPQDPSTNYPDSSHDMYPLPTGGLSYPQAAQDDMSSGMDYSTYAAQSMQQQQSAPGGMAYPHHHHQPSPAPTTTYQEHSHATAPEPVPSPAPAARAASSHAGGRHSLPSGSQQSNSNSNNGYSNAAGNGTTAASAWQGTSAAGSSKSAYSASPSSRSAKSWTQAPAATTVPGPAPPAAPTYDTTHHDGLEAAATLSQAALQKIHASPTTRTVSPFQNPTQAAQAARAKSRQGHNAQSRSTSSPFQQAPATQSHGVDTAAIYNQATSADANNMPNYDQYQRFNSATTTTQSGSQPSSSRVAYDYSQQTATNNSSASYPSYEAYASRTQAASSGSLAAPVTQPMSSASYSKTATAPSSSSWSNTTTSSRTGGNSYAGNNTASTSNSAYAVPASSTQSQQSVAMQSFNVRPQSNAYPSRTSTPTSYHTQQQSQQQPQQQQRTHQQSRQQQQQPAYSNYTSQQSQSSTNQQSQQQDWYNFGAGNNTATASSYGSTSRSGNGGSAAAGYGQQQSGSGNNYSQRAMNLSGNTYQSMPEQDLYDILRHGQGH